jgi:hypothetical protein
MPSPSGLGGITTSLAVPAVLWCLLYSRRKKVSSYNLDPQGKAGAFEPLLQKYLRLAEFTIGLATGSIVLIVGASFLHGKEGHLPSFYANPCSHSPVLFWPELFSWRFSYSAMKRCSMGTRTHPLLMPLSKQPVLLPCSCSSSGMSGSFSR